MRSQWALAKIASIMGLNDSKHHLKDYAHCDDGLIGWKRCHRVAAAVVLLRAAPLYRARARVDARVNNTHLAEAGRAEVAEVRAAHARKRGVPDVRRPCY